MLNLHLLRIFITVAELGNFSRAAEMLYISQPAVSRAVQELEHQIGMPLIDRSERRFMLTETGQLLYEYGRQIFATERAAEAALEQLRGLERGQLAIGASNTIGTYLLPPLLGLFHRRHPGVRLLLDIGNTQQIIQHLRNTPLDLAFVEGPVDQSDLVITPWQLDTLVVIAAPDHPLVMQQPLTLEQFQTTPFIMREPGSGTRDVIEQALRARDLFIIGAMELGSNQAVKQAVMAGLGISIVSEATTAVEIQAGKLAILDFPELRLQRMLTQVNITGRPASRALIAFQSLLKELSPALQLSNLPSSGSRVSR